MPSQSMPAAVTAHIRWMQAAHYSRSAVNRRQTVMDRLLEYVNQPSMGNFTRAHLAQWRDRRRTEVADSTLAMEASHVQSFLAWAYEREYLTVALVAMPATEGRMLDTTPREDSRTWLSEYAVREILRGVNGDKGGVLRVLAGTGLRKGEAGQLLVSWWDSESKVLRIPEYGSRRTKRHQRDLPAGELVGGLLDRFTIDKDPDDRLMSGPGGGDLPSQANLWLKPYQCSPHDLRRWYSNTLLRAGCPQEVRHGMLGHVPSRRDGAYERPTLEDMRPWADQVDETLRRLCEAI